MRNVLIPRSYVTEPPSKDSFILDPLNAYKILRSTPEFQEECQSAVLAASGIVESQCGRPIRYVKVRAIFPAIQVPYEEVYLRLPSGPYDILNVIFNKKDVDGEVTSMNASSMLSKEVKGTTKNPTYTYIKLNLDIRTKLGEILYEHYKETDHIIVNGYVGWPNAAMPEEIINATRLRASSIFDGRVSNRVDQQVEQLLEDYTIQCIIAATH